MSSYFSYSKDELDYLASKDERFRGVIDCVGRIKRERIPNLFVALVYSIIGQQISSKAQESICKKLIDGIGEITPLKIDSVSRDELNSYGISFRKVDYIKSAATKFLSGEIDTYSIEKLTDKEVIEKLTSLKGVGVWTAEMLMIFSLNRKNILSFGDFAIQRGLRMIFNHRKITSKLFEKYKRMFTPYASLASLYIWEISSGKYAFYKDLATKNKK